MGTAVPELIAQRCPASPPRRAPAAPARPAETMGVLPPEALRTKVTMDSITERMHAVNCWSPKRPAGSGMRPPNLRRQGRDRVSDRYRRRGWAQSRARLGPMRTTVGSM